MARNDLYYISVDNKDQAYDFLRWLDKQQHYPFSIVMPDGVCYSIKDSVWKDLFSVAFECGMYCTENYGKF